MTEKQIREEKKKCRLIDSHGNAIFLSPKHELLRNELYCRDMINSCLCYEKDFLNGKYVQKFIDILGEKRVKELYTEQLHDFQEATVVKNCFTDGKGLSYNHIIWADDKRESILSRIVNKTDRQVDKR